MRDRKLAGATLVFHVDPFPKLGDIRRLAELLMDKNPALSTDRNIAYATNASDTATTSSIHSNKKCQR